MGLALRFAAAALLSSLLAADASAAPVKVDGLPGAEFDKLPPDALLDVGGRMLTKTQFLAEVEARKQGPPAAARADFDRARAALAVDEKAANDAAASKVQAEWANVPPSGNLPALEEAPRITSVGPLPIRSGHVLHIHGSGFGGDPGQVHLVGPFPGGHLTLPVCAAGDWGSRKCWWRPTAVGTAGSWWGQPRITGIPDQELQVVVVTKKGQRSAPFPVAFRADRVLTVLSHQDVQIVRSNPAEGACTGGDDPYHQVTAYCQEGQRPSHVWHVGVDRISAKLRNGWTFDPRSSATGGWVPYDSISHKGYGFDTPLLTISPDRTTADAVCTYMSLDVVNWCSVSLWVTGPEGVPFH